MVHGLLKRAMPSSNTRPQLLRCWRITFAAMAVQVLLCGAAAASTNPTQPPDLPKTHATPIDLPLFDSGKAAALTPQKRAALEQKLFGELSHWNEVSRQYPTPADIAKREQRWLAMANEGLELAMLTLEVLRPSVSEVQEPSGSLRRLEYLAEQGAAGAMCLLPLLSLAANFRYDLEDRFLQSRQWMKRGAALGHPACQSALGGRLLMLSGGEPNNVRKGWPLLAAAAKAGHLENVGMLVFHLEGQGFQTSKAVKRLYCWLSVEPQTEPDVAIEMTKLIVGVDAVARSTERSSQLDVLRHWHPEAKDCVALGI